MVQLTPGVCARFQEKLYEVARLLDHEVQVHGTEAWHAVCSRISNTTGVNITLRVGDEEPDKHTHIWNALYEIAAFILVSENGPDPSWRVRLSVGELMQVKPQEPARILAEKPAASESAKRLVPATPIYSEAWLVRELDRRERERGPIFAGFIVNELLPRRGFEPADAKRILSTMEAQNMVHTERKPSPNDPARSTTFVTLNREHPHVARVLKGAAGIERTFPIGAIKGELLSERIIRERL